MSLGLSAAPSCKTFKLSRCKSHGKAVPNPLYFSEIESGLFDSTANTYNGCCSCCDSVMLRADG